MAETEPMNPVLINTLKLEKLLEQSTTYLLELRNTIGEIRQAQKAEKEFYVHRISNENVIAAHDVYEPEPVNNPRFNRGRVFLNAQFTPAHSGGLTVELWYTNQKIGDVMTIRSSNGAGMAASEPIDVAHLSGFRFVVRNHDQSNTTTIRNFRVVLYNEGVSLTGV